VPTWFAAALAGLAVGVAVAGAAQERRLGGAFVDASPELGYARWGADGSPEPWALIECDQCRHLLARPLSADARRLPVAGVPGRRGPGRALPDAPRLASIRS
jgi:hypothetical protein